MILGIGNYFPSLTNTTVPAHTLTLRGFSLRYGGSPSTISIAMIPRDQMSTLGPYAFLVTTSGAIQYGVPTMVLRLLCSGVIWAQKPKSAAESERDVSLEAFIGTFFLP